MTFSSVGTHQWWRPRITDSGTGGNYTTSEEIYRKIAKNSYIRNSCYNHPKILTKWLYHRVMRPKDADGMANRVDPDQTATLGVPLGAVWSGSKLFAQNYLSKKLRIITVIPV